MPLLRLRLGSAPMPNVLLFSMGRADLPDKLQSGALVLPGRVEKGRRLCATFF
jgi:hypothetical protein